MSKLEEKIAAWRKSMAAGGIKTPAVLDELESHLREDIRARVSAGDSEADAFENTVVKIGNPSVVGREFDKIKRPMNLSVKIGASVWVGLVILILVLCIRQLFAGRLTPLLAVHVLTLTTGYGAVYLIGGFALYYISSQWLGKLSPALEESVDRAIRGFTGISLGLVLGGVALGMMWSKQNRGFYWGNSPREIGPVCVLVWLIVLNAMELFNWRNVRARMLACVGGNVVVSLAWFGALILTADPALKNLGSYWVLEIFVGVHLLILAMGLSRRFETVKV